MTMNEDGQIAQKNLPDGRDVIVRVRIFNTIITMGPAGAPCYDEQW